MAKDDEEIAMAAGAAAGGHSANLWARQGREELQGSHSLTTPLARWGPELVESPPPDAPASESEPAIAIPESVLHARPAHRLPEDSVCRSPIAGVVVAVLAAAGDRITRRQPVMIVEAMKMLNNVSPEVDGVLKAVHVSPGEAVKAGQVLFELD